jgi:hypothetical protein
MSENHGLKDKTTWAIGGGLMLGLGVGFLFFPQSIFGVTSVFAFIGCMMGGIGLGLILTSILSVFGGRREK